MSRHANPVRALGNPRRRAMAILAGGVALTFLTGGCVKPDQTPLAQPVTVTATTVVTQTVTTPESSVAQVPAAPAKAASPSPQGPGSTVSVPDGVGLNYQEAQDRWRAAGLHVAPARDATGANRLPVVDANWVVVAQDLSPGSKVEADSFITATVRKYTDD